MCSLMTIHPQLSDKKRKIMKQFMKLKLTHNNIHKHNHIFMKTGHHVVETIIIKYYTVNYSLW